MVKIKAVINCKHTSFMSFSTACVEKPEGIETNSEIGLNFKEEYIYIYLCLCVPLDTKGIIVSREGN